jgi:hypothetical protein
MVELPTVVHFYFEIFGGAPLLAGALLHFYLQLFCSDLRINPLIINEI